MKTLAYLVGGFVALPFIGTILLQFSGAAMMANILHKVDVGEEQVIENPFGVDVELSGTEAGGRPKPGYVALATFSEPNQYRQIRIHTYLRWKDMLEENETLPDEDFAAAFASARVHKIAASECDHILKYLASKCTVENASADWNKDGLVYVNMNVNFVQKTSFGDPPSGKAIYSEVTETVDHGSRSRSTRIEETQLIREIIYQQTIKKCDKLKKLTGNCALFQLAISAALSTTDKNALGMEAVAVFSTVQTQ
jgi:hypothetical protein